MSTDLVTRHQQRRLQTATDPGNRFDIALATALQRLAADTLCQPQAGEELRPSPLFSSFDSPGGSASPAGVKARL